MTALPWSPSTTDPHFRYVGKEAAQQIIKLAAGNGFKKVYVGQDAIMATPAMSAFIRRRKLYGEERGMCEVCVVRQGCHYPPPWLLCAIEHRKFVWGWRL